MTTNEKFDGLWRWCETCRIQCIQCPICGSVSCSGHSEPCCHHDFDEWSKMSILDYPEKEGLPVVGRIDRTIFPEDG